MIEIRAGSGGARIWIGGAAFVFMLALLVAWTAQHRLDAVLDRVDVRALENSAKVFDSLLAQQRRHLSSTIAVLTEDARIRAMVLTPAFDRATVVDLLTDLKATSGASVVGILDSGGTVQAVVGAAEMDQLNLGTSSLIQSARENASAQLWAFGNQVGVLSAAPVRLDNQVRALFLMGFGIEDALLEGIQQTLGASGAVFVGDGVLASASRDPEIERALRSAAELVPGSYQVVDGKYLGTSSRPSDSAVAATVAWLVPLYRQTDGIALMRALAWLPPALVGLVLALMLGLTLGQGRAGPPRGT